MAKITLVDENDNVIGAGTQAEVWKTGTYHRIVRIFILNSRGQVLLARRGLTMRSLPGRWNESAAGHVDEGEDYQAAAERETQEELGVSGVAIKEVGRFKSNETDEPDKKKNRFTAVYIAHYDGEINPDSEEVAETKWISPNDLKQWLDESPHDFTEGCILGYKELVAHGEIEMD